MSKYPVFIELMNKRVVIIGGGVVGVYGCGHADVDADASEPLNQSEIGVEPVGQICGGFCQFA